MVSLKALILFQSFTPHFLIFEFQSSRLEKAGTTFQQTQPEKTKNITEVNALNRKYESFDLTYCANKA